MSELWTVTAVANGIVALAYFGISGTVLRGLFKSGIRQNLLGLATAMIFASCGLGHAEHALHPVAPAWAEEPAVAAAAEVSLAHPLLLVTSILTAIIGIWYWSLRARFPVLSQGNSLFRDLEVERRDALRIHTEIIAALDRAEAALDERDDPETRASLLEALDAAQTLIDDIIDDPRARLRPGQLRRRAASQEDKA